MTQNAKENLSRGEAERQRLGEKLRQAREYIKLSQDEVARHLGIPRTALGNIESGQRRVDAIELKRLAELYRQPISHFTGEEEEATALPADVAHLSRAAAKLSIKDREELSRFVEYLRARSTTEESKG
ncbi:MAG: helix-turn-helix domain-containing protein [Alphaproteobacteria bacterium]